MGVPVALATMQLNIREDVEVYEWDTHTPQPLLVSGDRSICVYGPLTEFRSNMGVARASGKFSQAAARPECAMKRPTAAGRSLTRPASAARLSEYSVAGQAVAQLYTLKHTKSG